MHQQDFTDSGFVRQFFTDLDRYLAQLRPGPGRMVALDELDRRHLRDCVRGANRPDFYRYKGLRVMWVYTR